MAGRSRFLDLIDRALIFMERPDVYRNLNMYYFKAADKYDEALMNQHTKRLIITLYQDVVLNYSSFSNFGPYHHMKLLEANTNLVSYIMVQLESRMLCEMKQVRSKLGSPSIWEVLKFDVTLSSALAESEDQTTNFDTESESVFLARSPSLKKYDVFISFRGDDIRSSFKCHLYDALSKKKIQTYIDDRLDKGDELWPKLVQAIEDSVLYLVVFSENYASSSWCLRELTHILECTKDTRHHVLPVFYKVDPSHVRYQIGSYKMAFKKLGRYHNEEEVTKWRDSLKCAASISGWDSRAYGNEVELIQEIVTHVLKKLDNMFQSVYLDSHFGIDQQVAHVESLLCNESQDVQCIGIWGITGIGKTTIATQLVKKTYFKFDSFCFLDNLREDSEKNRKTSLKKILLSKLLEDDKLHITNNDERRLRRMKVLVVLDDVNDPLQLTDLVGVLGKFGKCSRVIIIARDKQVFGKIANHTYEVKALGFNDALQLFKFHAFDSNCCDKEFEQLSQKVVDYANGIPSTLIALGSFLYGKSLEEWEEQLEKITKIPSREIQQILKLSYDGMDDEMKTLLLDIASTLNDRRLEHIKKLLDVFGYPKIDGLMEILEGQNTGKWKKEWDEKKDPMMKTKNKLVQLDKDQAQHNSNITQVYLKTPVSLDINGRIFNGYGKPIDMVHPHSY